MEEVPVSNIAFLLWRHVLTNLRNSNGVTSLGHNRQLSHGGRRGKGTGDHGHPPEVLKVLCG